MYLGAIPSIMQAASNASLIGTGGELNDFINTKSFTLSVLSAFSASSSNGCASLSLASHSFFIPSAISFCSYTL